ncbi:MAG: hypothetical protein QW514_04540 [Thermoprotei archaeon]
MSILAVIGRPVHHSLSPYLHHYCARLMGVQTLSFRCELEAHELAHFANLVKSTDGFVGFNVTMPHKSEVIGVLDGVDGVAQKLSAVNTVVKSGGKLWGYNTDWVALRQAVASRGGGFDSALVLGSGGAAAAAVYGLLNPEPLVKRVEVHNRSRTRFQSLKSVFPEVFEYSGGVECDVLVNATPEQPSKVAPKSISAKLVVDFPYSYYSEEIAEGYSKGGVVYVDGLELLARQGVEAMSLFFGGRVDHLPVYNFIKWVHASRRGVLTGV